MAESHWCRPKFEPQNCCFFVFPARASLCVFWHVFGLIWSAEGSSQLKRCKNSQKLKKSWNAWRNSKSRSWEFLFGKKSQNAIMTLSKPIKVGFMLKRTHIYAWIIFLFGPSAKRKKLANDHEKKIEPWFSPQKQSSGLLEGVFIYIYESSVPFSFAFSLGSREQTPKKFKKSTNVFFPHFWAKKFFFGFLALSPGFLSSLLFSCTSFGVI